MALRRNGGGGVLLLLCLLSLLTPRVQSMTARFTALRSSSSSGVIRLNDTLLRGILVLPSPRPFHFVVFFDARKLHSRSELALPSLKSEFSLVSSSFLSNNPDENNRSLLFFFDIEVEESQASFALFGVSTLPHIRLIPSGAADLKNDSVKLDASQFLQLADSLPELILSETAVAVGRIHRPPILSKAQTMILIGVAVIWGPYMVRMVASGKSILHEKSVWMVGAILVYFFSVSGTMYNIIRRVPMFMEDRRNRGKLMFFYKGPGAQLGAEGLAVGFLYTIVGVLMAFASHVLVRVRNTKSQRWSMYLVLIVSFFAVWEVFHLNSWKTGYYIHPYWPSAFL